MKYKRQRNGQKKVNEGFRWIIKARTSHEYVIAWKISDLETLPNEHHILKCGNIRGIYELSIITKRVTNHWRRKIRKYDIDPI